MNEKESKVRDLVGGGPQGSLIGQLTYLVSSDECPQVVETDDGYKYIDDLEELELVFLAGILVDYDFTTHVASYVGIDNNFLPPRQCETQNINNRITNWTIENKMRVNETKSSYNDVHQEPLTFFHKTHNEQCETRPGQCNKIFGNLDK